MGSHCQLSVVVSIYNSEKTLKRCVDSILIQKKCDLEIILVNDGSTDGSLAICQNYAKRYGNIKVVDQDNSGTVSARMAGVKSASADLIGFVDSDDYIDEEMYNSLFELYSRNGSPDFVSSAIVCELMNGDTTTIRNDLEEGLYDRKDIVKTILPNLVCGARSSDMSLNRSLCTKLIKKTLLLKVDPLLDRRLTLGEDGATVFFLLALADSVYITDLHWYHYKRHLQSQDNTYGEEFFEKCLILKECLYSGLERTGMLSIAKKQVDYHVKSYIKKSIDAIFHIQIETISFLFPYELIPKDSRVVIYGAGIVGKSYVCSLKNGEYASVVAWVDKRSSELSEYDGERIISVEEGIRIPHDYIILAINDIETAEVMRNSLMNLGIDNDKILWKKPRRPF